MFYFICVFKNAIFENLKQIKKMSNLTLSINDKKYVYKKFCYVYI